MEDNKMRINGKDRSVHYYSNNQGFGNFCTCDVSCPVSEVRTRELFERLDRKRLSTILAGIGLSAQGVETWGDEFGPSIGFNDLKRAQPKLGGFYIWLAVTRPISAAKVTIHPQLLEQSNDLENFGYTNLILDRFVTFLENPASYSS